VTATTIRLPGVLAQMVDGESTHEVGGETLRDVLHDLVRRRPVLGVHLFDESGAIRRHVICFHNGVYTRRRDSLDVSVRPGDTITIVQSVAGG
jgi:molybdopterin converting factor small subunit